MNKWLIESQEALSKALLIASDGSVPLYNIYMLAPIIYAERKKQIMTHYSNKWQMKLMSVSKEIGP